jgi:hypothetical protein
MIRSIIFALITTILLLPVASLAQDDQDERNALDYIPPSQFVAGWQAEGEEILAHPEQAGWLVGDDVYLLAEYDCVWVATENYSRGEDTMTVIIYEFPSASDAYGFYSVSYIEPPDPEEIEVHPAYHTAPPAEIETIRRVTYNDTEYLEAYQDRFYLRIIVAEDELNQSGLRAALAILGTLPGNAVPADMISILPGNNLIRGTERYIRGPVGLARIVGDYGYELFDFTTWDIKIAVGEYRAGESDYYLAVYAEFEDSDAAEESVLEMQDLFDDLGWETVIFAPLESGIHPRVFMDEMNDMYAAFWQTGEHVVLLWDISDPEVLAAALEEHG